MFLVEFLPPRPHVLWQLARQMGVTQAIVKCAPELTGREAPWDLDSLVAIQREFREAGLEIHGLEGDQFDMTRIKLGLAGRDEDIARYQRMLRNMGALGIRLLCYNFMAGIGWHRTRTDVPARGGARVSRFDLAEVPPGLTSHGEVPAERMWENYDYFLKHVLPVAEEAGVRMAAHPDDPPLSSLRGLGRILSSEADFERALALSNSPSHGLTFCQANWRLMLGSEAELARAITRFVSTGRVWFVHLRDVRGEAEAFEETFHDNGPTDMAAALQLYHTEGFRGPVRCDHVPTLAGEDNLAPGYGTLGRLFANGYLLGLMDALKVRTPVVGVSSR